MAMEGGLGGLSGHFATLEPVQGGDENGGGGLGDGGLGDDGFSYDGERANVFSLLPPDDAGEDADLTECEPVLFAQQEVHSLVMSEDQEEVNVVLDEEVDDQVVEVLGSHANVSFMCDVDLPQLVVHLKEVGKYVRVVADVVDDEGKRRRIESSNHQSIARVKPTVCSVPLRIKKGWNRVRIDLEDLTHRAFGTHYKATLAVRVFANCRIWRCFFQDVDYADGELPVHLRVNEDNGD